MERRGRGLLLVLIVLAVASAAVLIADGRSQRHRAAHSEQFQHLVGGLGFGPALTLGDCPFGFDPRLDDGCSEDCGPIPGGATFCPRHAESIFYYAPREHGVPLLTKDADETPP